MAVMITCTKQDDTTFFAEADSTEAVTFGLNLFKNGSLVSPPSPIAPSTANHDGDHYGAIWLDVPTADADSYRVVANADMKGSDNQGVPFGTCSGGMF